MDDNRNGKKEGGGSFIFDDSSDANRAVTLSDAYYGDGGSALEAVYRVTGKPVMRQNINSMTQDDIVLLPRALSVNEKGIYFSAYELNRLFYMDPRTGIVEIISQSNSIEIPYSLAAYFSADEYDGKIYFSPGAIDKIISYDYKLDKLCAVDLALKMKHEFGYKFHRVHKIGHYIYFVAYTYPAILGLDTLTNTVYEYNDWFPKIWPKAEAGSGKIWFYDSCVADKYIAAVSRFTPDVVLFNAETKTSKVYRLDCDAKGFTGICYDGEFCWISPVGMKYIIKWNPQNRSIVMYDTFPDGFLCPGGGVWGSFCYKDDVYLIPNVSNMVLKVNRCNGVISCLKKFEAPERFMRYTEYSIYNDKVFLSTSCGNEIETFDLVTGAFESIKMDFSHLETSVFEIGLQSNHLNGKNVPFLENSIINIHSFTDAVCKQEIKLESANGQEASSGSKIYNYIKSLVMGG